MKPFMEYAHQMLSKPLYSSDESDLDDLEPISSTDKLINGVVVTKSGESLLYFC
jgi:hypothetical protein